MDDPGIDQVVAFNMRRWRLAAGLTQEGLGQRIGWTGANVSSAERSADQGRDKRRFDAQLLVSLAAAMGVPVIALFLPPPGADSPAMADLFRQILPDSLGDSPAMDAYRAALGESAARYLGPLRATDMQDYLRDLVNADGRHDRLRQRIVDLADFEREYRRRLRASLQQQLVELGPPEEDE